jgi:DinB family protein
MRTTASKGSIMNRRELETLLLTLESTPALLARAAAGLSGAQTRRSPESGAFSFIEHVWHLADLEREGYGTRIRRLLTEEEPMLSNFDGDRAARERVYAQRDLGEGLTAFARARHANVATLRGASPEDWKRPGEQEVVGRVALSDIPRMMVEHDRAHTAEIAASLAELTGGEVSSLPHPASAVA